MIELFKLDHSLNFPANDFALEDPNGLLAFGGDLSPERLAYAYQSGIFPWFSEGEPILWWTPNPRGIIRTDTFKPSRSLLKSIRRFGYRATMNHAFEDVIMACANVPRKSEQQDGINSTWITVEMIHAYIELHYGGMAHSIEIWNEEDALVGGLYGVGLDGMFSGESMFHKQTDASKAAFLALVTLMKNHHLPIIDCQMNNKHLETLGCEEISRATFLKELRALQEKYTNTPSPFIRQTLVF